MKRKVYSIWLISLVCLALVGPSSAAVVTFDDITTDPVDMLPIPENYWGFKWDNFFVMDATSYDKPSGYPNGVGGRVRWAGKGIKASRIVISVSW